MSAPRQRRPCPTLSTPQVRAALDSQTHRSGCLANVDQLPQGVRITLTDRAHLGTVTDQLLRNLPPNVLRCNPITVYTPDIKRLHEPHLLWPINEDSQETTSLQSLVPKAHRSDITVELDRKQTTPTLTLTWTDGPSTRRISRAVSPSTQCPHHERVISVSYNHKISPLHLAQYALNNPRPPGGRHEHVGYGKYALNDLDHPLHALTLTPETPAEPAAGFLLRFTEPLQATSNADILRRLWDHLDKTPHDIIRDLAKATHSPAQTAPATPTRPRAPRRREQLPPHPPQTASATP